MKKSALVVSAFLAGAFLSAPAAQAASALWTHLKFEVNGKVIASADALKFGGVSYLPTPEVISVLKDEGIAVNFKGNLFSVGSSPSTKSHTPSKKGITAITDAEYQSLSNATEYVGSDISFSGQINGTPQVQHNKLIAQVDISPQGLGDIINVELPLGDNVKNQEFVSVTGIDLPIGNFSATPSVKGLTIQQTTWGQAFHPATQTLSPALSQTQNGLTVSITEVRIAKGQLRLHITAVNNTQSNVTIDDSSQDTLVQGTVQFNQDQMYGNGYPDFAQPMANGTTGTAVIVFNGQVSAGQPVVLTLPVSSDNYNVTWNNFVFTIPVN